MRALYLLGGVLALAQANLAQGQSIAIVHARAWTGASDAAIEDATIVVRDGKIVCGQTWESHPDFYREVFACLGAEAAVV